MSKPKVMVALRDNVAVEGLVTLACQLSQGMNAQVVALHVIVIPPVTPLDAEDESIDRPGKELFAHAEEVATRFSMALSTELVRAREVGEAIVGAANELHADLLVIGHRKPHRHALGEALFGGIVQYVAHHAPCRVIVQIPAPERG